MGERIFFSKLRKVLASWLLCIKFENARLVIFQIGYGPSHLISTLAVSRRLSPPSLSFCWQEQHDHGHRVCWERSFTPHTLPIPPLLLSTPFPAETQPFLTQFETGMNQQPNPKPNTYCSVPLSEMTIKLFPWQWDRSPVLEYCALQAHIFVFK